MSRISAIDTAKLSWGNPPDWILALGQTCDELKSQHQTAKRIGYSATAVNQLLKNKYPGNLGKVEDKVRAALMTDKVECPVLGEINSTQCLDTQVRPFSAASSQRVQLWKACQTCKRNLNN
ncbi:hypothetical protein [Maridesulfovibrio hydrothermalis]|uniref:Transcriptional regulator n=2 Tax=Maridesulfovibrio TaxID=2794998 RepID=L0R7N4_9BACT|nr:hypothetical protein [Maridesulfovibrio hydrothermalis]CCO22205.1 conserved protein of unknown function [Maridesulfovibrio hydrothermalis AM13 = DSM 14728]